MGRDWKLYVVMLRKMYKNGTNSKQAMYQKIIDTLNFTANEDRSEGLPVPEDWLAETLKALAVEKSNASS
jgi:hypothetical protein